jgi:hypothetical protein
LRDCKHERTATDFLASAVNDLDEGALPERDIYQRRIGAHTNALTADLTKELDKKA